MIKDAELRSKAKLIDGFIQKNVDEDEIHSWIIAKRIDGTSDLEERLNTYIAKERGKAISLVASEEQLDVNILNHYLSEYDYLL